MPSRPTQRTLSGWIAPGDAIRALLLTSVLLLVYSPAWNGLPVWDDNAHMTRPELSGWGGLSRIFFELGATQQYYPVTHGLFWLEHLLWGDSALGHHLLNILLHAAAALLLVLLLRRAGLGACAWLAASLWALHPLQVESVAWISELKNILSALFYLSAAILYLRFRERGGGLHYILALASFVAGLLSKSVTATLPAALLLLFWWREGRISWRRDARPLIPFFALGILSGLFTAWVEHTLIIGADGDFLRLSTADRILLAGRAFWFYLGSLVWPADRIFIFPRWNLDPYAWRQDLYPLAAIGLLLLLMLKRRIWGRGPATALLYFSGTLFPALGFLNIYPFRYSFVADHFQYLAGIGPIALCAAGMTFAGADAFARIRKPLCLSLLSLLAFLSWKSCARFTGPETLWLSTLSANPSCWMAYNNLGFLYFQKGRLDEALPLFERAVRENPDYAEAHNNLGQTLVRRGLPAEAKPHFQKALTIKPDYADAHVNLSYVLYRENDTEGAVAHLEQALAADPRSGDAHNNLGNVLWAAGRRKEAIRHFGESLKCQPENPGFANNLAWILSTGPDPSLRDGRRALELAGRANRFGSRSPGTLRTLAAAQAETGDFPAAVITVGAALEACTRETDPNLIRALRREALLYANGEALHFDR